jgi:hypothetical protein
MRQIQCKSYVNLRNTYLDYDWVLSRVNHANLNDLTRRNVRK